MLKKIIKLLFLISFAFLCFIAKPQYASAASCYERFFCGDASITCPANCPIREYAHEPPSCECWPLSSGGQINNPALNPIVGSGQGETIIAKLLAAIINIFFITGSVAVLIYFLMGGLAWITSEGDKSKLEIAKTRLTSAAFGIIVIASTYAVLKILGAVLGIDFFKDLIIKWPTITQ